MLAISIPGFAGIVSSGGGTSTSITTLKDVIGKTYGNLTDYTEVTGYWVYSVTVDPAGDDTTGLGTAASPFKTVEKALSVIPKKFDLDSDELFYLNINAGTYTYTPYFTSDTDYSFGGFNIADFYGVGAFNVSLAGDLQLTGVYDANIIGYIVGVDNCSIPVNITGGGTNKLSFEMTGVGDNYHCSFVSVKNSNVSLSTLILENNNAYGGGKSAYTYDIQASGQSVVKTDDVTYTIGKEGTVSFNTDNTSIVETDGELVGATALTRTYSTNILSWTATMFTHW
jgi:hypothetical protein